MTAGESTVSSRYLGVLFQGKAGSLIINAEKVVFRPTVQAAPGTKPSSRSWRWAAIERVEVMDPARGGSPYRNLKLKSSTCDKKAVTLAIPGGILDDVLKDVNRRLAAQPNSLGVEGPVQETVSLQHKHVAPVGHRRRSTNTSGGRSTSHLNLKGDREKPAPTRRLQRTRSRSLTDLDQRKKMQQQQGETPQRRRRSSRRPSAANNNRELSSSSNHGPLTSTRNSSLSGLSGLDKSLHDHSTSTSRSGRSVSSGGRSTSHRSLKGDKEKPAPARRLQRTRSRSLTDLDQRKKMQQQHGETHRRQRWSSRRPSSAANNNRGLSSSNQGPSSTSTRNSSLSGLSGLNGSLHGPATNTSRSVRSVSRSQRRLRSSAASLNGIPVERRRSSSTAPSSHNTTPPGLVLKSNAPRVASSARRSPSTRRSPSARRRSKSPVSSIPITQPPSLLKSAARRSSTDMPLANNAPTTAKRSSVPIVVPLANTATATTSTTKPGRKSNSPTKTIFKAAQQKLKPKYPLLKPPEKYRQIEEDSSTASSNPNHNNNNTNNKPKPPHRGFLNFMKAPAPRKHDDEIAVAVSKQKEQAARRRSLVEQNKERRASLRAKKDKLVSPSRSPKPKATGLQLAPAVPLTRVPTKNNSNPAAIARGRPEIVVSPRHDDASRTSASSSPDTFDDKPSPALWNPNAPEHKFRMMVLHHAATCQVVTGGACPYDPICCDFKRVLRHMETCNDPHCTEDKCKPTREFLVTMRLMTAGNEDQKTTNKEFLVGMGATAPIPVINVGDGQGSHVGDWDAFSMVSESSW